MVFLGSSASLCHAGQCDERVIKFADPIFPGTLNAVHVLNKEKLCSVDVAYSINYEGRTENLESRAEREICEEFKVSAMRTLRGSMFAPGDYLQLCFTRVTFKLEDGQLKWEFGPVPGIVQP